MKVGRRKSPEDFLSTGVLLKVMGRRAGRAWNKMEEKEKSTSALGKVIPLILQTEVKSPQLRKGVLSSVSLGPRARLSSE